MEEHDPSVSHLQLCFSALINNKQTRDFQSVPVSFATNDQVTLPVSSVATNDQVTQPTDVTVSVQLGPRSLLLKNRR